ncbi:MAG: hypothetical protein H7Y07_11125, partial [Pyrinomonadaceae bacterium]|nr:hypothetical protein [Sphingobacteriaceae bacterium]
MADLSFVNTREFSRLISRPSTLTVFDMAMLEDLVVLYPFSIPLHVSYAFALKKFKPEKYESYISKAALYTPDRTLLNKIIKHISDFENDENKPKTSQYILDDYQEQDQPTTENLPAENLSDGDVPHLNLGNNTEEDISSEDGLETESPSFNEEIPDDKWLNTQ